MDAIWRAAENAVCFASRYSTIFLAAIGIGFVRTMFGWLLGPGAPAALPYDRHLVVDLGEILVFVAFAFLARSRGPLSRRSWPALGAIALIACALLLESPIAASSLPAAVTALGSVCAGAAYALLLLVWLEACGCMVPIEGVMAIAGSYVVSLLGWFLLQPVELLAARFAVVAIAAICAFLLVATYFLTPGDALPEAKRSDPAVEQDTHTVVSVRILAWVALASLAYGFGDCFTQMGFATWASKVGMALPFVLIAAGLCWIRERFDLRLLYRSSLVLMAAGVLPAILLGTMHNTSQVLMSAAQAGTAIVSCAFACTSARRRHESAIFGCGIVLAASLAATLAGNAFGNAFIDAGFALSETMTRVAGTSIVLAVILLAAFLMRDEDLSSLVMDVNRTTATSLPPYGPPDRSDATPPEQKAAHRQQDEVLATDAAADKSGVDLRTAFSRMPAQGPLRDAVLERAATQAGLSKRETVVYLLMAQGKNVAQIGDELFIAPGTVRAHMSRIYDKLGVSSREEFARLLGM